MIRQVRLNDDINCRLIPVELTSRGRAFTASRPAAADASAQRYAFMIDPQYARVEIGFSVQCNAAAVLYNNRRCVPASCCTKATYALLNIHRKEHMGRVIEETIRALRDFLVLPRLW